MFKHIHTSTTNLLNRQIAILKDRHNAHVRRERLREDSACWDSIWSDETKAQASYFNLDVNTSMVVKGGNVLDVGCGDLFLSEAYKDRDRLFVGVDISGVALRGARMHMDNGAFVRASGMELPFPDNSFDAVIALDVVSIMGNDSVSLLREMRRVTAGKVIFDVAHKDIFCACHTRNKFGYGDIIRVSRFKIAGFDGESLGRLLRDLRLEPLKIKVFMESEVAQYALKNHSASDPELRRRLGDNTKSRIVAIARKSK